MEDHGLDPTQIGVALDVVLSAVPTLSSSLASARSQLQKCQVQREKFHSKLRKQVPDSTPPPPHA